MPGTARFVGIFGTGDMADLIVIRRSCSDIATITEQGSKRSFVMIAATITMSPRAHTELWLIITGGDGSVSVGKDGPITNGIGVMCGGEITPDGGIAASADEMV